MMDNNNISFMDIDVNTNMPIKAPETWTREMLICLFAGGYWCGTMTFVMFFVVKMQYEQQRVRCYCRAAMATTPFWAKWHSSMASQLTRRDWPESSDDDTRSSDASTEGSLYEEVVVRAPYVEYAEISDWDPDVQAIHYWRPFEDGPTMKQFGCNLEGEC